MAFAHATCIVTRPETRAHGTWLREFWLIPETTDWVEVDHERPEGPRSRPYTLPRVLAMRGLVGELLAQEFLEAYPNADELLALQREVDELRASEDERDWSEERRAAISRTQEALEDAVYASPFPLDVNLLVFDHEELEPLRRDFLALNLPLGRFVDATPRTGAQEATPPRRA